VVATHDLADRLHSTAIHLLRRVRREDDASGLSAPRLSALSVLVFGGPRTLGELAAAEQVRPPTMSRIVDALERQRLVARESDPGDARRTRLRATRAGEAILARGRARRVDVLATAMEALPSRDRATLARAVDVLARVVRAM
jgi:DNA-binding MarR family transcriptional regulator